MDARADHQDLKFLQGIFSAYGADPAGALSTSRVKVAPQPRLIVTKR